ncbi:MAG TPA: ABC transporter substrate-binding protein, partial [Sphaerochaeta sp.]|nr:ABC transporter substrate-binding protein [Sphaerochaeta sp.]
MRLFTRKVVLFILALAILSVPVFARGSVESVDRPEITVGSKIDTEGALLGT